MAVLSVILAYEISSCHLYLWSCSCVYVEKAAGVHQEERGVCSFISIHVFVILFIGIGNDGSQIDYLSFGYGHDAVELRRSLYKW